MSSVLAQRALALAGAALLLGVAAVAATGGSEGPRSPALPRPAVGPGESWYTARAGIAPLPPARGRPSACGWVLRPATLGVIHSVLPCGAKIFLAFRGRTALTRVVAHGPLPPGRQLDLTPALAALLGLEGVEEVRWAFARD